MSTEAQKRASAKYYQKHKEYYKKKTTEEMKKVRQERNNYKNIINELEKYMKSEWNNENYGAEYKIALSKVFHILQELKGENNGNN